MQDSTFSRIYRTSILSEVRRRLFEESFPRIHQCLDLLTIEQIWYRPNPVSNSVGNLVLHICGNLGQWLISGLGNQPDNRDRSAEFSEKGPLPKADLRQKLQHIEGQADQILDQLTTEHLLHTYQVQAFRETGISILVHVVEHTSYHVGQITLLTKWQTGQQTNYYGDIDLEEKNKGPV